MKEYPILFKGPMVRAILDGRKTQTRRVIKPQPRSELLPIYENQRDGRWIEANLTERELQDGEGRVWCCPYGIPGNSRLWVRETIRAEIPKPGIWRVLYAADGAGVDLFREPAGSWMTRKISIHHKTIPSIHMPRWASRLTLEVTGIRVERVQDISTQDAKDEGLLRCPTSKCDKSTQMLYYLSPGDEGGWTNPVEAYENLWNQINTKRGYGWNVNPWVWVVEFRKLESEE